ncbi:hypothetical protein DPMN_044350 [Dreissena polymorpha]|uniref:PHD-type domain-containing protein n=1 Tax=Dreissena polymorpha TaxID=45954 RepID=A0A9D4I0F7_DREPO|nr:hypothetical protein DPMN_044350 [Dreissena polymorpha]
MLHGSQGCVVIKAVSDFRINQEWLIHGTDPPGNECLTSLKESSFNANRDRLNNDSLKMCKLDNLPVRVVREQKSCGIAEDEQVYCTCRGIDDESFMIDCDVCEEWFHGKCVGVTEEQGEKIDLYTCPSCRTG